MVTPLPPVKTIPLVEAAYQSRVAPVEAVAPIITGPAPVLELSTAALAVGKEFTVIAMAAE